MWTVLKFDKKRFNLMLGDMKKKYGNNFIIYRPKILVQKYRNNKLVTKEVDLLGDYLFCFNANFKNKSVDNELDKKFFILKQKFLDIPKKMLIS